MNPIKTDIYLIQDKGLNVAAKTQRFAPPKNTQMIVWVRIVYKTGDKTSEEIGFQYFMADPDKRMFTGVWHYDQEHQVMRDTTTYFPFENILSMSTQDIRVVIKVDN